MIMMWMMMTTMMMMVMMMVMMIQRACTQLTDAGHDREIDDQQQDECQQDQHHIPRGYLHTSHPRIDDHVYSPCLYG